MQSTVFSFFVALLFAPTLVSAGVMISEVAWMGTETSPHDEWIELFNNSPDDVLLDGWVLESADGTPRIELAGTMAGYGYFILERTDDNTLPLTKADLIYTGALSNKGEEIFLKNSKGEEIDYINAKDGWFAGDNKSKETMQKDINGAWVTASPSPYGGMPVSQKQELDKNEEKNGEREQEATPSISRNIDDVLRQSDNVDPVENIDNFLKPNPVDVPLFFIDPVFPKQVSAGVPAPFRVTAYDNSGTPLGDRAQYQWDLGDGAKFSSDKFLHMYQQEGGFIASVIVFWNGQEQHATSTVLVSSKPRHLIKLKSRINNNRSDVDEGEERGNNPALDANIFAGDFDGKIEKNVRKEKEVVKIQELNQHVEVVRPTGWWKRVLTAPMRWFASLWTALFSW